MFRSGSAQHLDPGQSTVNRPWLGRTGALIAALAAVLTMLTPTAASAAGPSRNGECQEQELCMFHNSNVQGSVSDFTPEQLSIPDYGSEQPTCYEFKGPGNGIEECIKNNVASVWNRTGKTINIYYNSNYNDGVAVQVVQPGFKGNLNAKLKNNNASHLEARQGVDSEPTIGTVSHVETSGGAILGRAGPGTGYDETGRSYDNGQPIRVVCTTYGSKVDGTRGPSELWHKLVSGDFVSGAYVRGQGGMPCEGSTPETMTPPDSVHYIDTDGTPLTVRSGPGLHTSKTGVELADLTPVTVDCLLYGTSVTGTQGESSVWLRLGEGSYVAAAYVHQANDWTPEVCGAPSSDDAGDQWPDCSLGGSEEEVYALMFGGYCMPPDEVMATDPGDPNTSKPDQTGPQRPFLVADVGPNGENSYGLTWDGCSVPEQAALIPHMGDPSYPFGFNFRAACQVHDLGYRLMDRHILPESAEQPLDRFFTQMLGRICRTQYYDRLVGCMQVATAYGSAVTVANHKP
ncbi:phospholipase A2 [Geodermatophilus maliterrae]|uniref:Phospholipase A2 n=1 Tax=Geodermatophilus maliterrae TaxID=3162531 RepID=A0ABV3XM34_9ACTN